MKHPTRSLAYRFLLFLGGVLLLAIAALFLIERYLVMPELLEQEDQRAGQELARISKALDQNRNSLLAQVRDWAHWDDTYDFILGRHASYSSANFSREMFEDLHYQLMVFFDAEQHVHWVAGIDPQTEAYTVCGQVRGECAWAGSVVESLRPFLSEASDSGFAFNTASPWPALAAISPVLRTDRSGPSPGWLAKIRLIDPRLMALLEEQTGLPVDIGVAPPSQSADDMMVLAREGGLLQAGRPLATRTAGPSLQLNTRIPREGFQRIVDTFHYALVWTAALLLLVITLVLWLLAVLVIRPLGQFTRFASRQHGIPSFLNDEAVGSVPPVLRARNDELGTLARHFQSLLQHQYAQSQMLLKLSQQDPLTGLANRRLFDERLAQELAERCEVGVSVLMIDIDHFKLYNDHYGHPAGDSCLARVAEAMQQSLGRRGFLVARTGGEEFNVLMPQTSFLKAMEYAETLRQAICGLGLPHPASPISEVVTVSIGVASDRGISEFSGTRLMSNADQALYQAKASGRNRVTGYGQVPSPCGH